MKRNPTPAQKKKADARRAAFRQLVKKLSHLDPGQRKQMAAQLPALVNCEGRQISAYNHLLISFQRESVTMIGGFRQWQKQGRQVSKGERGLMIWIPTTKKTEEGATPDPDSLRFITGTVFDVSQTQPTEEAAPALELAS